MITPIQDLKTPEDGQRLDNRRGRRQAEPDAMPAAAPDLRARIEAARSVKDTAPHCRACFERGRDAALAALEAGR